MAKFARQHYEAVAKILAEHTTIERRAGYNEALILLNDLTKDFCKLFAEDNEHFDSEKFIEACQNKE